MEPANQVPVKTMIPPTPGEVITSLVTGNTYTIGDQIGEGHFGLVFGCRDVWDNDLAVKVLKPIGSYDAVRASAEREFRHLVNLRNPFLTFVHDAFEFRDTFYIVTERCYCTVGDLFSRVADFDGRGWLNPIGRCVLQGVNFLHLNGVAHQDIHLGNVFATFARNEMVPTQPGSINFKIGDLGVAKVFAELGAENTRARWMLPPEVLQPSEFGPIDHRVDIYHVGLLLLQLALSQLLEFTEEEILAGRPRELALTLPQPKNLALEKALRRHAQLRTSSAMELWRDLQSPTGGAV